MLLASMLSLRVRQGLSGYLSRVPRFTRDWAEFSWRVAYWLSQWLITTCMLVRLQPPQVQGLPMAGSQAHDLGVRVQFLSLRRSMNESAFLASVLLFYLLLEAARPFFLLFFFLLFFILTSSGWVSATKVVLVISSFCLLALSRRRGSFIFLLLVTLSSLLLVCSVNWLSVYLALELQALSLFVLTGLFRSSA